MLNLENLNLYIPNSTIQIFENYFNNKNLTISLAKQRNSKLGDFKFSKLKKTYQITINYNLCPEAFSIVLAHELAHYETFTNYKNRVSPHGNEWKKSFSNLLNKLIEKNIFNSELKNEVILFSKNPKASFRNGSKIFKLLSLENETQNLGIPLHSIEIGTKFYINNKKSIYIKGEKRKLRYFCSKEGSNLLYLASPNLLVHRVE